MAEGTVLWFDSEEGRGEIRPDGGDSDLRVDYWEIQTSGYKTLDVGQRVAFAVASDVDGVRAVRVAPLAGGDGGSVWLSPGPAPTSQSSRQELPLSPWFYVVFALLLVLALVFTAVVLLAGWSLPGLVWFGLGLLLVVAYLLAKFHD